VQKKFVKIWQRPAVILLLIFLLLLAGNNWLQVTRFRVKAPGLPSAFDGYKIVHIGDLHGKEFGANNRKLARLIKKQKPDLILASGDLLNSQNDNGDAFISLLKELEGVSPVYCSLGNHEQIVRNKDQRENTEVDRLFEERILNAGGIRLNKEWAEIIRGGERIRIAGFTAALYHYTGRDTAPWEGADLTAAFIEEKLGPLNPDHFTLLLAHNPKYLNEYAAWGADLVFSGHIHGGVIRLPILGGIFSPDITFLPPYDAGLYHQKKTTMHVTRGLGNAVIPLRFLNRPEIAVIELQPGEI
jgi:predicted MPP superfamily phosphohydrolase